MTVPPEDRIERIVERKLDERFGEGEPNVSRRQALGLLAGGAVGGAMAGGGVAGGLDAIEGDAVHAQEVRAERVAATEELTVGGLAVQPGQRGGGASPDVIYADSAEEIQPAIDQLASDVDEHGARGGVVQLAAKTYFPETTIWLKSGVTLQGARRSRVTNPHRTNDVDVHPRSTVLSTAEMATGAEAYTFEHDPAHPHPHFPVVANYMAQPVEEGSERTRDPTEEERRRWGHDVALRNVVIQADETRWWDWDDHGGGSVYTSEREATYFGVYDAVLFEQAKNVMTENVDTRGFLGYGGFFKDTRNVVDRGSRWSGGATDHHGAAFQTFQDGVYVSGVWDFQVDGPMPTAVLEGHIDNDFVSSAFTPQNSIVGRDHVFIGDEAAYWAGDAPLADPDYGNSILVEGDQRTRMDGYTVSRAANKRDCVGVHVDNAVCTFTDVTVSGADEAFLCDGGAKVTLRECKAGRSNVGIKSAVAQPDVAGFYLEGCDVGFSFLGRSRPIGTFDGVTFQRNNGEAFGEPCDRPVTFNYPSFYGVEAIGEEFGSLTINNPAGYAETKG